MAHESTDTSVISTAGAAAPSQKTLSSWASAVNGMDELLYASSSGACVRRRRKEAARASMTLANLDVLTKACGNSVAANLVRKEALSVETERLG